MQFQELYANYDGLDMAFHGTVPAEACRALEIAKSAAQAARRDVLATVGGLECHVAETGGRGGFGYRFDTGPDGEIWWIKSGAKPGWNVRVSVRSAGFLQRGGLEAMAEHLRGRLAALGFVEAPSSEGHCEAVSRVDFAMDFLAPGLALDPRGFVAKASRRDYHGKENVEEELAPEAHWMGARCTGVTVGKMPGRQVVVYDKTADVRKKGKAEWFKAWGTDPADKAARVWRIEVRAGKKHLRETWGIRTLVDVENCIGDVFADALAKIRYCLQDNARAARRTDHPLWVQAVAYLRRKIADTFAGLLPGVVREVTRERAQKIMTGLLRGLSTTYAAIIGGARPARIIEEIPGLVSADLALWVQSSPEECLEKLARAFGRYHFITPEQYQQRRYYAGIGRIAGIA